VKKIFGSGTFQVGQSSTANKQYFILGPMLSLIISDICLSCVFGMFSVPFRISIRQSDRTCYGFVRLFRRQDIPNRKHLDLATWYMITFDHPNERRVPNIAF
jgi:hypothetical protein